MTDDWDIRWREIVRDGVATTHEVDSSSQLRLVYGIDALAKPFLLVITRQKPGLPHLKGAVTVERRFRERQGEWTLTFVLNEEALRDTFITLAVDLAERCGRCDDESQALATLVDGVAQWQRLLRAPSDRLSTERLRGLMGELWYGFVSQHHGLAVDIAAEAWDGPLGGNQDFGFPEPNPAVEVKTVRPGRDSIDIASEHQLDGDNLRLAVVTLADSMGPDAQHLPGLVGWIMASMVEPLTRATFNTRLVALGVNLTDPWYLDQTFTVTRLRVYDVNERFPALRPRDLPDGVGRTEYRLDLAFVDDFLVDDLMLTTTIEGPVTHGPG